MSGSLQMYPVPADRTLWVNGPWTNASVSMDFIIRDLQGRMVRNGVLSGPGQLDLHGMPAGGYVLEVISGELRFRSRFVRSHIP